MNKMSIKKDDLVVVLSGKDKGKQGKVLRVIPKESKVVVEKVNVVSRHTKPRKQGEEGGILQKEARCRRSAPSATSPPASATRSRAARRSASARSAAPRSKERRSDLIWQRKRKCLT